MKRFLAVLGVFALLGTLAVFAAPTASAGRDGGPPSQLRIENHSAGPITITSLSGCGGAVSGVPFDIKGGGEAYAQFTQNMGECEATVVAQDTALQCIMKVDKRDQPGDDREIKFVPGNTAVEHLTEVPYVVSDEYGMSQFEHPVQFQTASASENGRCVQDKNLDIHKYTDNDAQASFTTFNFNVDAWSAYLPGEADTTSACADSTTTASTVGETDAPVSLDVLNGYLVPASNSLVSCNYKVTEDVPAGWTLYDWGWDPKCNGHSRNGEDGAVLAVMQADTIQNSPKGNPSEGPANCNVWFDNEANPVPIIVTKTFVGRTEYTTLDRADFHVFTPGDCSGIPIDPFGNLLGSTGIFRTVNASQDTQFVIAPYGTSDALPYKFARTAEYNLADEAVKCTTRVQETHAPDGCTPQGATGSNADGPYWEQTWEVGMESMVFPIVNDCSEPTPEPSVAPTSVPKKPGAKKPSGGGTAAPKFTG